MRKRMGKCLRHFHLYSTSSSSFSSSSISFSSSDKAVREEEEEEKEDVAQISVFYFLSSSPSVCVLYNLFQWRTKVAFSFANDSIVLKRNYTKVMFKKK